MQYPSKKLQQAIDAGAPTLHWLQVRREKIEQSVAKTRAPFGLLSVIAFTTGILSLIVSILFMILLDTSTLPITISFIFSIALFFWMNNRKEKAVIYQGHRRTYLKTKLKHHPLSARAHLIENALAEYQRRLNSYTELFHRVDEGLLDDPKPEVVNNQWVALVRANAILTEAATSFQRAIELDERNQKFRQQHPENPKNTGALALLLEELKTPIELPPELTVDLGSTIEEDSRLLQIIQELDRELGGGGDDKTLAKKIESLASLPKTQAGPTSNPPTTHG